MKSSQLSPTPEVWLHILFGDIQGGGHLAGQAIEGKTEFPSYWSLARIEQSVLSAVGNIQARNPHLTAGAFEEFVDGLVLRIVLARDSNGRVNITTAYPLRGNGVFKNIDGVRISKPLLRQDRKK
jgi:hypothetical protein